MTGRRIYLKGADSTDYVVTGQLDDGGIEFDRRAKTYQPQGDVQAWPRAPARTCGSTCEKPSPSSAPDV